MLYEVITDEDQTSAGKCGRKVSVLREESVSGVHGLGPGTQCGTDDGIDVEVTFPGRRRADPDLV